MSLPDRGCQFPGCDRAHHKAGYCVAHYVRRRKHGDPSVGGALRTKRGEPRRWLEAHVDYDGDGCLIWPFSRLASGYGNLGREGAHRYMCRLINGPPPTPGHEAAHSCGRGAEGCVDPRHLRWATRLENAGDRALHGTLRRGERGPCAKLTQADVDDLRRRYSAGGATHRQLAAIFGINQSQVSRILARKRWLD